MTKLIARAARTVVKTILTPAGYGALLYRLNPAVGRSWGGPFNGQRYRCLLVADLIRWLSPKAIVETGTYRGSTTEWLAAFQVPVFSCELSQEHYAFARSRLAACKNVMLFKGDSRSALKTILRGHIDEKNGQPILVYLDAHWNDDLPLLEEIDYVYGRCPSSAVVIDDFEVGDDAGYGYDDYGGGKALTLEYLRPVLQKYDLSACYPATPSGPETGARGGCLVSLPSATPDVPVLLRAVPALGESSPLRVGRGRQI